MSGADLEKIINDAAILAGSEKAASVTQRHILTSLTKNGRGRFIASRLMLSATAVVGGVLGAALAKVGLMAFDALTPSANA